MIERKLDIFISCFAYGGNGGVATVHPDVMSWLWTNTPLMKADERVGKVALKVISDTPITMTRNAAVEIAKNGKYDCLLMLDSDMAPDVWLDADKRAKPFWKSSFDFLFAHWEKGPVAIAAPYCGPPPHPRMGGSENIYAFKWANIETDTADDTYRLDQYSREEAAKMGGIQEAAAAATGMILYDMRCFDLTEPPYFYYEWEDDGEACAHCGERKRNKAHKKVSTEDVTQTRDMSINGSIKLGYNPLHINWDAWAGHWKPKCVTRPKFIHVDHVSSRLAAAVNRNHRSREQLIDFQPKRRFPFETQANEGLPAMLTDNVDYQNGG